MQCGRISCRHDEHLHGPDASRSAGFRACRTRDCSCPLFTEVQTYQVIKVWAVMYVGWASDREQLLGTYASRELAEKMAKGASGSRLYPSDGRVVETTLEFRNLHEPG